jgi:hypothetical protein
MSQPINMEQYNGNARPFRASVSGRGHLPDDLVQPTIIALSRGHARTGTIFTFNLLVFVLGSTLGLFTYGLVLFVLFPIWVWMFVWAVMGAKKPAPPRHYTFFPEAQQHSLMKS